MLILIIALFGSVLSIQNKFFSLPVLTIFVLISAAYYIYSFLHYRKLSNCLNHKSKKFLALFLLLGTTVMTLSFMGFYQSINRGNVLFDSSYILRQAYYLYFIPLILFAGSEDRISGILKFLKIHAKKLFLVVYALYLLSAKTIALNVPITFLLGFLLLLDLKKDRVVDLLELCVLMLSPINGGGGINAMSNKIFSSYNVFFKWQLQNQ